MNSPIVIIGSGLAGITVARELRKLDKEISISIVTADEGGFYSKPSLSTALVAKKLPDQLLLTSADDLERQLGVNILRKVQVEHIDSARSSLQTNVGDIDFAQLVLALGANQVRLPLTGSGVLDILSVNSLPDYAGFREKLAGARRVAIIGAGLIGCEFANDLARTGYQVTVFDIAERPLSRLVPKNASDFLRSKLESEGVRFVFSTTLISVHKNEFGYRLADYDGNEYSADLVLSAVGLAPEIKLAKAANLSTHRGIVVDRYLQTSNNTIYAIGDCAEVEGHLLPYVMPIMHAAKALAKTLAGTPTPTSYPPMPIVVKTPACPAVLCPPPQQLNGTWEETVTADGVKSLYIDSRSETASGFVLLGDQTTDKQRLISQLPNWL